MNLLSVCNTIKQNEDPSKSLLPQEPDIRPIPTRRRPNIPLFTVERDKTSNIKYATQDNHNNRINSDNISY